MGHGRSVNSNEKRVGVMIDSKKLAELRETWEANGQDVHFFSRADFEVLAKTIEFLWKENAELKQSNQYFADLSKRFRFEQKRNAKLEAVSRAAEELDIEDGNVVIDGLKKLHNALAALHHQSIAS
jgi:hypothetical protein